MNLKTRRALRIAGLAAGIVGALLAIPILIVAMFADASRKRQ